MRVLRGRQQPTGIAGAGQMFRLEEGRPFTSASIATPLKMQDAARTSFTDVSQQSKNHGYNTVFTLTLCTFAVLFIAIIGLIGYMYYTVTGAVSSVRDFARPLMQEAVDHTLSILTNADESMIGTHTIVSDATSFTHQAVPAMQLAMNQTSEMITRLERLAQHPVLQLSLTQGQVTPPL